MSSDAEESYFKQYTSYGRIAYGDIDDEDEYEEPDQDAQAEARWESEDGR